MYIYYTFVTGCWSFTVISNFPLDDFCHIYTFWGEDKPDCLQGANIKSKHQKCLFSYFCKIGRHLTPLWKATQDFRAF